MVDKAGVSETDRVLRVDPCATVFGRGVLRDRNAGKQKTACRATGTEIPVERRPRRHLSHEMNIYKRARRFTYYRPATIAWRSSSSAVCPCTQFICSLCSNCLTDSQKSHKYNLMPKDVIKQECDVI